MATTAAVAAGDAHALATIFFFFQTLLAPFLFIRDLVRDLDRHPADGVRPFRNRGHRAAAVAFAAAAAVADWRRTFRNSGPNLGSVNIATAAAY